MMRRTLYGLSALATSGAIGIAGCSGSGSTGSGGSSGSYSAGSASVVNASASTGGTLTYDLVGVPDSTDYQNTYDAYMWNFVRLYSMQLMTYRSCPGQCGLQLVPDLATAPGIESDSDTVWTYHIKPNVKFENGHTVTSEDVKYGIERTYARSVLPNGPDYYQELLQDPTYPGPYTDRAKNVLGLTSITTPNPTTIQFHLARPFADFNYVVAIPQSTPVEPTWDAGKYGGASFQLHPESTGPYKFKSYALNKQFTLVKNTHWNPATDPQASQLVDKIVVRLNLSQNQVDNNLLSDSADVDLSGAGVQTAAVRDRIITNATDHANSDNPIDGFTRFAYLNLKVIPNVHCREAIEYAADKSAIQNGWGGPESGQIASTVMPPNILGYTRFDEYNALTRPDGDDGAARQQLKLCGQSSGFATGLAYRTDRPQEVAAAQALQQSLSAVGIKVSLDGSASGEYSNLVGSPASVHAHDLGIVMGGWGADWPDGYGFLAPLAAGNAISATGNTNIAEVDDPTINGLFAKAASGTSRSNLRIWGQIDKRVMSLAAILPMVYQKVLLYRNPNVTNVYVDSYYGTYNYAVLGLK